MTTGGNLPAAAARVKAALESAGHPAEIRLFAESTRTAQEAAEAIGTTVAQIAKSLVFRTSETNRPVLAIASGANRIDEKKLAKALAQATGGEAMMRADADFVRRTTGYAIGGVPPVGHAAGPLVAIDKDLVAFDEVWAAAGTPNAVFRTTGSALAGLTGGTTADIARR